MSSSSSSNFSSSRFRFSKFEYGFSQHPKVTGLSCPAFTLWVCSIDYASERLTGGAVNESMLTRISQVTDPHQARSAAQELVDARLWDLTPAGWAIHDFDMYQNDAEERKLAKRKADDAERQRRKRQRERETSRDSHVTDRVTDRVTKRDSHAPIEDRSQKVEVPSSSESEEPRLSTEPTDDDRAKVRSEAAGLIAARRAAQRTDLRNPGAWIRRTAKSLDTGDDRAQLDAAIATAGPDATAETIADIAEPVDPPPAPLAPHPAIRPAPETCDRCVEHHGWLHTDDGSSRCDHQPVEVPA